MITAIVLIQADTSMIPETAEELLNVPGVQEVYSVAGDWDLVAVVRVKEHDQLADVVADHISKKQGIVQTHTLIAFKSYSRVDLQRMWEIGMDEEAGSS